MIHGLSLDWAGQRVAGTTINYIIHADTARNDLIFAILSAFLLIARNTGKDLQDQVLTLQ